MSLDRLLDPELPAPLLWFALVWLFAVGACIGSFMNVVIYRLPAGLSLLHPPSRCPACETPIRATDNVPIFGWLRLRGRCRNCRAGISPRYPAVELLAAVVFAVLAWVEPLSRLNLPESAGKPTMGQHWGLYAFHLFLACSLICAALIEFDGHALPLRLAVPAMIVGLAAPAIWPHLRPDDLALSSTPALNSLADGIVGALFGAALGWAIGLVGNAASRPTSTVSRNAAVTLALVGAFLAWRAAAAVAVASALTGLFILLVGRVEPNLRRLGLTTWIALWSLVLILSSKVLRSIAGLFIVAYALGFFDRQQTLLCAAEPARATIVLTADARGQRVFELHGLSKDELAALAADFARHFAVYCLLDDKPAGQPPLAGRYKKVNGGLQFMPLFPLQAGMKYQAAYRPGGEASDAAAVTQSFELPREPDRPPAKLLAIYPTAATLPQNQLKFYLYFSAPMSRGSAYEHVRLLDGDGRAVDLPFLELAEELWNPAGDRLTLLLDPARVKQDLKPRKDAGPVLEVGRRYTLMVGRTWPDARGRPLMDEARKTFQVAEPDEVSPNAHRWRIGVPAAASRSSLTVDFGEPLDRALLDRMLWVVDSRGRRLPGQAEIGEQEASWSFRPDEPWQPGEYRLIADVLLEDLAGNSIGRKFELVGPPAADNAKQAATVAFRISE